MAVTQVLMNEEGKTGVYYDTRCELGIAHEGGSLHGMTLLIASRKREISLVKARDEKVLETDPLCTLLCAELCHSSDETPVILALVSQRSSAFFFQVIRRGR